MQSTLTPKASAEKVAMLIAHFNDPKAKQFILSDLIQFTLADWVTAFQSLQMEMNSKIGKGIDPEVETTLRLLRMRKHCLLAKVPKDVFNLILMA